MSVGEAYYVLIAFVSAIEYNILAMKFKERMKGDWYDAN